MIALRAAFIFPARNRCFPFWAKHRAVHFAGRRKLLCRLLLLQPGRCKYFQDIKQRAGQNLSWSTLPPWPRCDRSLQPIRFALRRATVNNRGRVIAPRRLTGCALMLNFGAIKLTTHYSPGVFTSPDSNRFVLCCNSQERTEKISIHGLCGTLPTARSKLQ